MMDSRFDTDIALIGFGPTGGVLASLLGSRGVRVDVFERDPEVFPKPRAVHFDAEVMRVLQQTGVADSLAPVVAAVRGMHLRNAEGAIFAAYAAPAGDGPLGWPEGFMCHQPELERALRHRAAHHPTVTLHLGREVQSVRAEADGSGAVLQIEGEEGPVRARFVVGCCGARSITRAALGTGLHDYGLHQPWLVLDVMLRRELPLPDVTVQYCEPARPSTYVPMPGGRRRFEIMVMPGDDPADLVRPDRVAGFLSRWLSPDDYDLERAAVYTFHSLVAHHWRRGPLLIAGDAAHQMPPFLGQGMCAGIRDAANLFWKLDLMVRGIAGESLLDTYQAEREPHVRRITEADLFLGGLIQTTDPAVARRRDAAVAAGAAPMALTLPPYPVGPGLCADGAAAGLPFPQPRLAGGEGHDDLLGDGFALVGAVEPSASAARILGRLGTTFVPAPHAAVADWLAAQGGTAALVRPDRVVLAVVSSASELDAALAPLAAHLLPAA